MLHPLDNIDIRTEVLALPKADLHLHAEAGPRLHRILAHRRGESSVDWGQWACEMMSSVPAGMDRLNGMSKSLISDEDDADPTNFLARVKDVLEESARSGASYVEVRFGRETVTRPDFITLFRQAEEETANRFPLFMAEPLATLIPQMDSDRTDKLVTACIAIAGEGLAGVDIIPRPYDTEADWIQIFNIGERLANAGLPLTVHAGEFSIANMAAALQMPGVRRIGHGIQAATDKALLDQVAQSGVALECCPTSNVILGAVESYQTLPLVELLRAGLPVTLNTDNPMRFGTNISREYELASRIGLSQQDLAQATSTAIEFAFTTEERKKRLRNELSKVQHR